MNKKMILIGILLIAGGVSALNFITVPSLYGIGEGVENIVEGEEIKESVVGVILGGVVLYFTTGLFIVGTVAGVIITMKGFIAKERKKW